MYGLSAVGVRVSSDIYVHFHNEIENIFGFSFSFFPLFLSENIFT